MTVKNTEAINNVLIGLSNSVLITGITMSELEDHLEAYDYELEYSSAKHYLYEGTATNGVLEPIHFSMQADGETFIERKI